MPDEDGPRTKLIRWPPLRKGAGLVRGRVAYGSIFQTNIELPITIVG